MVKIKPNWAITPTPASFQHDLESNILEKEILASEVLGSLTEL